MPRQHDFTRQKWGHHVGVLRSVDGGKELRVSGWSTPIPERGDHLLLPDDADGVSTRYRVRDVRLAGNPPDQWFATLDEEPRRLEQRGGEPFGDALRAAG
jgi:hypothetical protein